MSKISDLCKLNLQRSERRATGSNSTFIENGFYFCRNGTVFGKQYEPNEMHKDVVE